MYYVLEGETVRAVSAEECHTKLEGTRRIQLDEVNGYTISSVFLGSDHGMDEGEPVLFETMVFHEDTGYEELWMSRSTSVAGIKAEHQKALEWVSKDASELDDAQEYYCDVCGVSHDAPCEFH